MDLKEETPSKSQNIVNRLTAHMSCDSPLRRLPNISTPPSRFTKIFNPFESHLVDRLHLPTFSPSVFAQVSTPKTDNKFFKWNIENISSLKPADIDEAAMSQHVSDHDPTMESIVQEKINKFFNEKAIVPSPLNEQIKQMPLYSSPVDKEVCDTGSQTVLSLPPVLPKEVEAVLAPYFKNEEASLYTQLFEFDDQASHVSSPPLSTGLSPIDFSPEFNPADRLECSIELPKLRDCSLSPIGRSPLARSACRLDFSSHMSVDTSVVPNAEKTLEKSFQPLNDSAHWDMEYRHVSLKSVSPDSTPHSRIFTSQRKRLSDSFKDEEEMQMVKDVEMMEETGVKRLKNDDVIESGYMTGGATICEASYMFASTPTKIKHSSHN